MMLALIRNQHLRVSWFGSSSSLVVACSRSYGGGDGATCWLAGAVRVLQKEVCELKGLLGERPSDLGKDQDELAEMHITKKLKNAHATTVAKSYGFGEARPRGSVKYRATTEFELAESSGQFSVEVGEARPLGFLIVGRMTRS